MILIPKLKLSLHKRSKNEVNRMNYAAKTILPFGIYVIGLGVLFLVIPEFLFGLMGIITTPDVVSRIFGVILMFLGYYYIRTSLFEEDMSNFFRLTTHTRSTVIIFLVLFVILGWMNPLALSFGAIDFAGAMLTLWGLHKDKT